MTRYEWSYGVPVKADSDNYEWTYGIPEIVTEVPLTELLGIEVNGITAVSITPSVAQKYEIQVNNISSITSSLTKSSIYVPLSTLIQTRTAAGLRSVTGYSQFNVCGFNQVGFNATDIEVYTLDLNQIRTLDIIIDSLSTVVDSLYQNYLQQLSVVSSSVSGVGTLNNEYSGFNQQRFNVSGFNSSVSQTQSLNLNIAYALSELVSAISTTTENGYWYFLLNPTYLECVINTLTTISAFFPGWYGLDIKISSRTGVIPDVSTYGPEIFEIVIDVLSDIVSELAQNYGVSVETNAITTNSFYPELGFSVDINSSTSITDLLNQIHILTEEINALSGTEITGTFTHNTRKSRVWTTCKKRVAISIDI